MWDRPRVGGSGAGRLGLGIGRPAQDEFAAQSHQRAADAIKNGLFADEITPVSIPQRKGDPLEVTEDEGVRADTTVESLARLRPAFGPGTAYFSLLYIPPRSYDVRICHNPATFTLSGGDCSDR